MTQFIPNDEFIDLSKIMKGDIEEPEGRITHSLDFYKDREALLDAKLFNLDDIRDTKLYLLQIKGLSKEEMYKEERVISEWYLNRFKLIFEEDKNYK